MSQAPTQLPVFGTHLAVYSTAAADPAVVFINGLGDPASVWQPVVALLEGSNTFVAYDRAGTGASGDLPPAGADTPLPASWAAEQLHELLNRMAIRGRVVLVGHSVGGQIADAFAVKWPDLVAGLVLVDAVDPTLNLRIDPPRRALADSVEARTGAGWIWDVAASAAEYASSTPAKRPPTVVIASAIWRWFRAKQPELYSPLSLADVDQGWQRAQLNYAHRWAGSLIVAHDAGHRLHEAVPELVATSIMAVIHAAVSGGPTALDQGRLVQLGGSIRPTTTDE